MQLEWTEKALSDLVRLHEFLSPVNPRAADHAVQILAWAPSRLIANPRLGERLEEFAPREVRLIVVGKYEIRYEVRDSFIYILRIWHSREDR